MKVRYDSLSKYNIEDFSIVGQCGQIVIINIDRITANLEIAIPFKEYVLRMIEDDVNKIIVDLSQTDYIDSTFLGSLVVILKKLDRCAGQMKLVLNDSSKVNVLFEITNMDNVFDIYNSLEEAKSDFLELAL